MHANFRSLDTEVMYGIWPLPAISRVYWSGGISSLETKDALYLPHYKVNAVWLRWKKVSRAKLIKNDRWCDAFSRATCAWFCNIQGQ